ncbi:MAG: permease [Puniceicoccaceae bacterium]|nr:MAG: permease [Puniceicoccaceae bacterium]
MHNYQPTTGNPFVVDAAPSDRAAFIRRTYLHLAGALICFVLLEAFLLQLPGIENLVVRMVDGMMWLVVLGAFIAVSWLADRWARSEVSETTQYIGLALYVAAQSVIFLPLLYVAAFHSDPTLIPTAGIITGLLFAGLTATAFMTRTDFSFLRGILAIGGMLALGVIVCSILFGFELGLIFSAVMVGFAAASILYTTSNIIHHYRTHQHVAASLALFAGVMLMFWYILRILLSRR